MKVYHILQVDNQYQLIIGTIKYFIGGQCLYFKCVQLGCCGFQLINHLDYITHIVQMILLISDFLLETGQEILYISSRSRILAVYFNRMLQSDWS